MFLRHFSLMVLLLVWAPAGVSAQEFRACYHGPPDTIGVGLCRTGTQTRTASGWSVCEGEILPIAEVPDNRIDEDCNGGALMSLGSCGNDPSVGTSCSVGLGECAASGTVRCLGSTLGCSATPGTPTTEIADNGLDEDCDGSDLRRSPEPLLLFSLVFMVGSGCYYLWLRARAARQEKE